MKTNRQSTKRFRKAAVSLIVIGAILIPTLVAAKTNVVIGSASTAVRVGQQVSVSIMVAPVDVSAFTSKVVLSYPSNLLDVSSFSFAPTWIPLSMPGYDSIDASAGTITKTAGYPNGIASGQNKLFGTIIFTAKQSGDAIISVMNTTQIFDAQNKNEFSGASSPLTITINAAPVTTPVVPIVKTIDVATTSGTSTPTVSTSSQVAASVTSTPATPIWLIIIAIMILGAIGYEVRRRTNLKK